MDLMTILGLVFTRKGLRRRLDWLVAADRGAGEKGARLVWAHHIR